jgi:hypothetical protein
MFDFSGLVILETRGKVNKFINFAVEILANMPIILLRKLLSHHQGGSIAQRLSNIAAMKLDFNADG